MFYVYERIVFLIKNFEKIEEEVEDAYLQKSFLINLVLIGIFIFLSLVFLFFGYFKFIYPLIVFIIFGFLFISYPLKPPFSWINKFFTYLLFTKELNEEINKGKDEISIELQKYQEVLGMMSHEDNGPWNIWAQKAQKILEEK